MINSVLLEEFFADDYKNIRILKTFSEAEKVQLSKNLVELLYQNISNKSMSLDYEMLEGSQGDFKQIKSYIYFKQSLDLLNSMQSNLKERINNLDTINNAYQNLLDNTDNFKQGFKVNNELVMMIYNNISVALISSLSFLISTTIDYIKDPTGDFSIHYKSNVSLNKGFPTVFLDSLDKFNKMCVSGELAKFFTITYSKKSFLGIDGYLIIPNIIIILVLIIPLLRELIYQFYYMRVSLSDYIRVQADFIELNQSKISNIKEPKKTKEKQKKIAEKLIKIADKIDVDQKISTKTASSEINKENNSIKLGKSKLDTIDNTNDDLL